MRLLPARLRATWEQEIPRLEFAASAAHNETLGMSPFKFIYGFEPAFPTDLRFVQPPPQRPLSAKDFEHSPGTFAQLAASLAACRALANKNSEANRLTANEKLNKYGSKKSYKVDDAVMFWMPPSKPKDGWRAKHADQWKSAVITKKVSPTWYVMKDLTGRVFERSVGLLKPRHGVPRKENAKRLNKEPTKDTHEGKEPSRPQSSSSSSSWEREEPIPSFEAFPLKVGDVVAALDTPDADGCHIAKVIALKDEDEIVLHYYATTEKDIHCAKFRLAWIDKRNTKTMLRNPRKNEKKHAFKWTGTLQEELIPTRVRISTKGKLTHRSIQKLQSLQLAHIFLS